MIENMDPEGEYIYLAPVTGVAFSDPAIQEFRIDRVTLFTAQRFSKIRRYRLRFGSKFIEEFIATNIGVEKVVAVLPFKGTPSTQEKLCHSTMRDELNLLAAARLGYSKRTRKGLIAVKGCQDSYVHKGLFVGRNVNFLKKDATVITSDRLYISKEFFEIHRQYGFFCDLLKLVRRGSPITSAWRSLLRDVALLAGKSQNSIEIADAFLWNMIALDHLLLKRQESGSQSVQLIARIKAFLGYCPLWDKYQLQRKIERLYILRCGLVHSGEREKISLDDLIVSDELLRNLLRSIMANKRHLNSKQALIDFAEKEVAKEKLGMEPRSRKWDFSFVQVLYTEHDFEASWNL